jgi:predicted TIM-barrel fold metal-dependent hydrolase
VLELDGVALLSNVAGTYPGDAAWDPLFAELDRRAAYVFLHPTMPPAPPAIPSHPVWLYEFPFDTTRAVVNLIYSGTLERCPNLRLQIAHLGGAAPFLAPRIASLVAREPERGEPAPAGAVAYLGRLYYDTGLANNALALDTTLAIADPAQIVFGTDWPYADLPPSGDPAPGLAHLDDDLRARIDAGNAAALVPRRGSGQARSSSLRRVRLPPHARDRGDAEGRTGRPRAAGRARPPARPPPVARGRRGGRRQLP